MKLLFLSIFIILSPNAYTQTFPDFTLVGLNGDTLTLKDLKGKKVYINVFETWCKPCASEVPLLNKTLQDLDDVLIVAITPAKANKAKKFKEKFKLEVPVYPNAERLCREIGATQYPSHYVIDQNGNFRRIRIFLGVRTKNAEKASNKEMTKLMLEQNQTTIADTLKRAFDK